MTLLLALTLALQESPKEHLKRLDFLIGTWHGTGTSSQGKFTEEATYEWRHDGHLLQQTSVTKFGGKLGFSYTCLIGWDAEAKKFAAFYYGLGGMLGWGEQAKAGDGELVITTPAFRIGLRKIDADHIELRHDSAKESGLISFERRMGAAKDEAPVSPTERMKRFETLIGVWVGTSELGGMGKVREESTFEWVQGGAFVRTTQKVYQDKQLLYTSSGMIAWDDEKKKYVWFHFGMEGSIGWAMGEDPFVIEGALKGDPMVKEYRIRMWMKGADQLGYEMEIKQDGKWLPFVASTAERKK